MCYAYSKNYTVSLLMFHVFYVYDFLKHLTNGQVKKFTYVILGERLQLSSTSIEMMK
jgi:hypothetical protein